MEALRRAAANRIAKQTEGLEPEEVRIISLHGQAAVPDLLKGFTCLTQLTLVSMRPPLRSLNSLFGAQSWSSLQLLDASDNAISVTAALPGSFPSLKRLLLVNNAVAELSEIDHLAAAFPQLEVLDLFSNAVSTEASFVSIFDRFPQLSALDSRTRDGVEVIVEDLDESDASTSSDDEEEEDEDEEDEDEESGEGEEGAPARKRAREE